MSETCSDTNPNDSKEGTTVPYRWEPTPEGIAKVQSELQPHRHDPDTYWPILVERLEGAIMLALDGHSGGCESRACRACMALARLETIVKADCAVQPTGCSCPEHRLFPHRLEFDAI